MTNEAGRDAAAHDLLAHTDPVLVSALRALGDQYGPLGVALSAAALTDPEVLDARMVTAGLLAADYAAPSLCTCGGAWPCTGPARSGGHSPSVNETGVASVTTRQET